MSYKGLRPGGYSSEEDYSSDGFEGAVLGENRKCNGNFNQVRRTLTPEDALFEAVKNNDVTKVKDLISQGVADLNALQSDWSPLMYSCFSACPEILELLLSNGSDVNFHKNFFTPLMLVCSNAENGSAHRKEECVKILIDHGADVSAADRFRMTALMFAAREGLHNVVKLLIEKKCDLNKQDRDGWTALFHAVYNNKSDVVDILVEAGVNIKLKDLHERTAHDLGLQKGFDKIAEKVKIEEVVEEDRPILFDTSRIVTIEQMFNQLPCRETGEGFRSEIFSLLDGMNLSKYSKCFYDSGIKLGEFLVINDERLKEIGVQISSHRHRVLSSLKRFHLHRWQKSSISVKPKTDPVELIDGVKVVGNALKQLYVIQSTLKYIDLNRPNVYVTEELNRIINSSLIVSQELQNELIILKKYSYHIDRVKKAQPVDLIKKENPKEKIIDAMFKISAICFGIFVVWKCKDYCLMSVNK